MNDPGLDDAIADEANALDHTSQQEASSIASGNESQNVSDAEVSHAARWWLASTAYPLAAVSRQKA